MQVPLGEVSQWKIVNFLGKKFWSKEKEKHKILENTNEEVQVEGAKNKLLNLTNGIISRLH